MNRADREAFIQRNSVVAAERAAAAEPLFSKAEAQAYQQAAAYVVKNYPEVVDGRAAEDLIKAGADFHPKVTARAVKDVRPDFQAYIFSERGRADAHALNNVRDSEAKSIREYERIIGWIERNGLFQTPVVIRDDNTRTDEWLAERAATRGAR